jgi:hypothetical protein
MRYLKLFEDIVPAYQSGSEYRNRNTDETTDVTKLDSIPLRSPVYQKGEILIFSEGRDVDYEFAERLLKRLGLKLIGEPYDRGFLVKCEPGKEVESAKMAIAKYPDFFDSYEREDIRMPYISDKVDVLVGEVEGIVDFFESTLQKNVNSTKYNKYIDNIINELDNLKIK